MDNFDPYNVFLAIATNIPVRLMTGFVVQGHICMYIVYVCINMYIIPRQCYYFSLRVYFNFTMPTGIFF